MLYSLLIYNTILLLACAAALGVRCSRGTSEWLWRIALLVVLLVPAALRSGIGTDYPTYVDLFNTPNGQILDIEPGYAALNGLLRTMGAPVEWLFAVVALLTYAPIAFGVRRQWIVPVVALFVLTMYLASYSLIRQSLVVSWVLVALLRYIDDQHIGRVYLWVVIASFFHLSALLVLPFVLVRRIHIPAWCFVLLLPLLYAASTHGFIDALFSSSLFHSTKYGVYANSQFDRKTEMGSGLGVLIRMLIPAAYIVYARVVDRQKDFVLYTIIAYVGAYMLSVQVHIFNRLVDAFSFAPVLAFAVLNRELKKRLVLLLLLLLMLLNFEKTIVANTSDRPGGLGITPYVTLFEK